MSHRVTIEELVQAASDGDLQVELLWHLERASRFNPSSSSRRELHRLLDQPHVLDFLERILSERES